MSEPTTATVAGALPRDLKGLLQLSREIQEAVFEKAAKATGTDQAIVWELIKLSASSHDYFTSLAARQSASKPAAPMPFKFIYLTAFDAETTAQVLRYYKYQNAEFFRSTGRKGFGQLTLQSELMPEIEKAVEPIVAAKVAQIRQWKMPRSTPSYAGGED